MRTPSYRRTLSFSLLEIMLSKMGIACPGYDQALRRVPGRFICIETNSLSIQRSSSTEHQSFQDADFTVCYWQFDPWWWRRVLKINTFSTSGTLGPQWTRIVHQISQNLPQLVLRELGKIVRSFLFPSQILLLQFQALQIDDPTQVIWFLWLIELITVCLQCTTDLVLTGVGLENQQIIACQFWSRPPPIFQPLPCLSFSTCIKQQRPHLPLMASSFFFWALQAAAGGCPPERETLLPPGSESTRRRALPPAMPPC